MRIGEPRGGFEKDLILNVHRYFKHSQHIYTFIVHTEAVKESRTYSLSMQFVWKGKVKIKARAKGCS